LSRDRTRWIRGRATFLVPVKALSVVFRAKYLAALHRAFTAGPRIFASGTAPLADAGHVAALLAQLRTTPWVVYAKRPCAGPERRLPYLGRYTHRSAISNARLISVSDGIGRFRYKDDADHGRTKVMALGVEEWCRRFRLHVLPRGFVRIRHFGLLANRHQRATIARARHLLGVAPPPTASPDSPVADSDRARCPICRQGQWHSAPTPRKNQPLGVIPGLAIPIA
jgi:hypothetical protein